MTTRQAHRVQVLAAGQAISAPAIRHEPQSYQVQLRAAKERFGAALCACQSPPLQLVIRERSGKLFLAAWPDQAASHALDCPFYSERGPGVQQYGAGAIDSDGASTRIALLHPLRQDHRVHGAPRQSTRSVELARDGEGRKQRLHLWGLLHYLWEETGLNRWHPGWHRDWGFVRYALRRAAQSTLVDGQPLLQSLYVPPVWKDKNRTEIQVHWQEFVRPLLEHHRRAPVVASSFVIGTVRELEPTDYGMLIKLHHHAERFYMDKNVADSLARYSRRGWAAVKRLDPPLQGEEKPYVVAAMRVQASQTGRMTIVEAVLMRVSPRYIPVNSSYEDKLARVLVEHNRQFVRPLHYDNHALQLPDFILKDADARQDEDGRRAVAMYVYGASVSPIQKHGLEADDRRWAQQAAMDYWQWDAAQHAQPPTLPPAVTSTPVDLPKADARRKVP